MEGYVFPKAWSDKQLLQIYAVIFLMILLPPPQSLNLPYAHNT